MGGAAARPGILEMVPGRHRGIPLVMPRKGDPRKPFQASGDFPYLEGRKRFDFYRLKGAMPR